MGTFFSDTFGVAPETLDSYGAFDISIINDLPLFIDPFLLFHSDKDDYQQLHDEIIKYLVFLRDRATQDEPNDGLLRNWYCFPEVKQNWLGFSMVGNGGSGLGIEFARNLHKNLGMILSNFGNETITEGSHLEKVCLIKDGVGRDNISDFVTNLVKDYFCNYTQEFSTKHISDNMLKTVTIDRAIFNYETETWQRKTYTLPWYNDDFVILTPKDMLTRDDTWINRGDMISGFERIPKAISDGELRASVSNYFELSLKRRKKPKKPLAAEDYREATAETINQFPQLIDYYIKLKEMEGDYAVDISNEKVFQTETFFSHRIREILRPQLEKTDFYTVAGGTYAEAHTRLAYLKHAIEDQGCWRIFYDNDNKPVEREKDIQILFRLVWFGTRSDIGSEANDGRGPVDFKVSRGRHKTLVEMKLAKNSKIESNLKKQIEIYKTASDAEKGIKVILYFDKSQFDRITRILKRLKLEEDEDIVLLDGRNDNKPSGSKAK